MEPYSIDARAYETYIGRWSSVVAREFLAWLDVAGHGVWHDVACGTGSLTNVILSTCDPARVDASDCDSARIDFVRHAIDDTRVRAVAGDATAIFAADATYDAVVCGLGFPQIRDTPAALGEFRRVVKPGGVVAAYLWDFDGDMQLLRYFWDAATDLTPGAEDDDDEERFAICHPERLRATWRDAGFARVAVRPIDARARFVDFDDYWTPFLCGDAPAQAHVRALDDVGRERLRDRLHASLPVASDGSIELAIRAWAVKGIT
ncbi:MAG: class I SAM-dependent methyltransferase [Vulcanimicrobiaceae bacterium]